MPGAGRGVAHEFFPESLDTCTVPPYTRLYGMSGLYDKRLDIRLTSEELGWIRDAAWQKRVSTSSWVRDALFAAAHEQGTTVSTPPPAQPAGSGIPELDAGQGRIEAPKRPQTTEAVEMSEPAPKKSGCTAYAPHGTRCKICGKVHSS